MGLFFLLCLVFFLNIKQKLVSILYLEGAVLALLVVTFLLGGGKFFLLYSILFLLTIIMVLERVFRISLFIGSSRDRRCIRFSFFSA